MVRSGTLPLRLLALEYGCDVVFGEEIIAQRITGGQRVVNEVLGTVDYVSVPKHGHTRPDIFFRTCDAEKGKVVFQLGTSSAVQALEAAQTIIQDVDGIDINMGCPLPFSVKGGMGSALLTKPETAKDILSTLVRNLDKPVSCKIRLLPKLEDTLALVKVLESTGIHAITVHNRFKVERPRDPAHYDQLPEIVRAANIPVICNGDVFAYEDIAKLKELSGCSGVMMARGALWNPSIFSPPDQQVPLLDAVREYLRKCMFYDNSLHFTKYTLGLMLEADVAMKKYKIASLEARTWEELSRAFDVTEEFRICRPRMTHDKYLDSSLRHLGKGQIISHSLTGTSIDKGWYNHKGSEDNRGDVIQPKAKKVKVDPTPATS
eukprot:TRINITY_DN5494_c0_g1_i3.p1 TRINITY_DN5494_c0_g1~~TRINITY_DN5494_c0_g1_i3.p1  ORF type:complete len:376 (+),score=61.73 TRINITY_DN5494_c0_g1_i3:113-1240(+)